MKFAVVGKDVSKSVSPQIHLFIAGKLNKPVEYDKISVPENEFETKIDVLIKSYDGLNVTIPYKLSVMFSSSFFLSCKAYSAALLIFSKYGISGITPEISFFSFSTYLESHKPRVCAI